MQRAAEEPGGGVLAEGDAEDERAARGQSIYVLQHLPECV